MVVAAIGFQAARALAPQATALWPYYAYHDMRWLLVYHDSLGSFVALLVAVTVLRGLTSAGLVVLSWPRDVPRPPIRWLVRRNLDVAALAAVVVSPWAALAVAFSVVAVYWVLLASLGPMLLLSPFLVRAGTVKHWWRGLPSLELLGWSALSVALLTLFGALAASTPGWWAVPVVAVAGAVNGLLRRQAVREALRPEPLRWPRVPVAPLAIGLVLFTSLLAQSLVAAPSGQGDRWRPPIVTEPLPSEVRQAVIVLAGYDSTYDGRPAGDPMVQRFSYRGLDAQGRPLPYPQEATHQALGSSADLLAAQVATVHRRTGRPVALIGQSEGALVARTYLERTPGTPVQVSLEFSPLIRPGRGYYPPPDARDGWGLVAGWELRAIFGLADLGGGGRSNPDEPLFRSIMDNAPLYRNLSLCPIRGVRVVGFLPTGSAVEAPPGQYTAVPVYQVPALHGGALGRQGTQQRIIDVLQGASPEGPRKEYALLQHLGAAWQTPPLAISVNPAWRDVRQPDPAFSGRICQGR
ncbi:hypothetical protein ACFY3U_24930 [Micromonospora sp. NPDC000089]|uniref:hypothetical protein n=1 Tax=unclassified Micromonospora TaxID=2617518 RepID=UPI0036C6CACD